MKKRKRKIMVFIVAVLIIEFIHLFVYINYGLNKSGIYIDKFIVNSIGYSIAQKGYYLDLIPYDDLSLIYKIIIDEEEFTAANTDEKCFKIYNKVIENTSSKKCSSFFTTIGNKNGTYYESLTIDGIKYSVNHNIEVKTNYFTLKPYISKWIITIEEVT